ncbi:MAG: cytidine deaminase [Bacteroidales bacterium]|nr:cytidine deaminase [Bacteroidales bacterium]
MEKTLTISYREYESMAELPEEDRNLMQHALGATESAYVPYSHFRVGAAIRLGDGTIVEGSNQENLAYPSGLCAERTAMFAASARYPEAAMEALAVVGVNPKGELTEAAPCGACRQVMAEYEGRQGRKMRILTYLEGGKIRVFDGVECLLPFIFQAEF